MQKQEKLYIKDEDYFSNEASIYVSVTSTGSEEVSRMLVEDGRSWELNDEPSKSYANMNYSARCCSGWISLGGEYWCVTYWSPLKTQSCLCLPSSGRIKNNRTWNKRIKRLRYFVQPGWITPHTTAILL